MRMGSREYNNIVRGLSLKDVRALAEFNKVVRQAEDPRSKFGEPGLVAVLDHRDSWLRQKEEKRIHAAIRLQEIHEYYTDKSMP